MWAAAWLVVAVVAAGACWGEELCPEYASFLRANDLACERRATCTTPADCQAPPGSAFPQCYVVDCDDVGECAYFFSEPCLAEAEAAEQAALDVALLTQQPSNTAQCHGEAEDGSYCYTGLCNTFSGECVEYPGDPSLRFACDCRAQRYLECATDADCAPLAPPENQTACRQAVCRTDGFCEVRTAANPVPDGCCQVDGDCADGNECTVDTCDLGDGAPGASRCVYTPNLAAEGCCESNAQCMGPSPTRDECPAAVCDTGACLTAPAAPTCTEPTERCVVAEGFSYCAAETVPLIGSPSQFLCTAGLGAVGLRCAIVGNDNQCLYGTCERAGDAVFCVPLAELANTPFPCDCRCGPPPLAESQACILPPADLAYQCVPVDDAGGAVPPGEGSLGDAEKFRNDFEVGYIIAVFALFGITLIVFITFIIVPCLRPHDNAPRTMPWRIR